MNNKDFNDKYSFIAAKDYFDLQKESAAPKDLGNPYGKEKSVSLLGGDTEGVNPIYIVEAQHLMEITKGAENNLDICNLIQNL